MNLHISPALIRQYAIVLSVNLSVLTTGINLGWASPMLVKLQDPINTPLSRPMTDVEGSWMVSLGILISTFTNVLGGYALDIIGRKPCILLLTIPKLSMSLVLLFASEPWMVILARTILLIADCFTLVTIPVYAAEIASKNQRGTLGTLTQVFSSLGMVISLAVGPYVSYHVISCMFCGFIVIMSVPLLFVPESPYYLHNKGKTDEALAILKLVRESEIQAKQELTEYMETIDKKFDKIAIFKDRIFVKALLLALLLFGATQFVGFNAVTAYLQTILISTNTQVMPEVASAIIGGVQFLSSLFVTFVISSYGRKTIFLVSLGGMCLGMIGLGVFFQTNVSGVLVTGFMNYLPLVSLILVVICYSAGLGATIWPTTTELFEGQTRAYGVSIGLVACQLVMFFTMKYFSSMTEALGPASTYWFFSTNCVIFAVLIAIFLPETKGKSFAEIQKALGKTDVKEKCVC